MTLTLSFYAAVKLHGSINTFVDFCLSIVYFVYLLQFKSLIKTKVKASLDDYEGLRGTSFTSVGVNFVSRQVSAPINVRNSSVIHLCV